MASPQGHVALPSDAAVGMQAVIEIWEKFESRFLDLWNSKGSGDLYLESIYGAPGSPALKVL